MNECLESSILLSPPFTSRLFPCLTETCCKSLMDFHKMFKCPLFDFICSCSFSLYPGYSCDYHSPWDINSTKSSCLKIILCWKALNYTSGLLACRCQCPKKKKFAHKVPLESPILVLIHIQYRKLIRAKANYDQLLFAAQVELLLVPHIKKCLLTSTLHIGSSLINRCYTGSIRLFQHSR